MTCEKNFEILKNNIRKFYYDKFRAPDEIIKLMLSDGSFEDLDYADQNWTTWHPFQHIKRVADLCRMYSCPDNPAYKKKNVSLSIHKALGFYLSHNFVCDNWWMNDVGVPNQFGIIILLFGSNMDEFEYKSSLIYAKGSVQKPRSVEMNGELYGDLKRYYRSQSCHLAGQVVDSLIYLAYTENDADKADKNILKYMDILSHDLTLIVYDNLKSPSGLYCDEHSVKYDYSYHEHENGLLPNSYGAAYLEYIDTLFKFTEGTQYKLSDDAYIELSRLMLYGFRYMNFRGVCPMMLFGREAGNYARGYNRPENAQVAKNICRFLADNDVLKEYSNQLKEMQGNNMHFTGTKYFWQSDLLSHNRGDFQFTVHGASERMKRTESILGKNLLGKFLSDGAYNILVRGDEYDGLQPYYDWKKIPGTTVNQKIEDLNPESEIDTKIDTLRIFGAAKGNSKLAGGVADGMHGIFVMDYSRFGVSAKKLWICTDDAVLCMGTGISSEGDADVFTTVNQCRKTGNVTVDGAVLGDGEYTIDSDSCVLNDKIGYVFMQPTENILLSCGERSGAWSRIDSANGTDDVISGDVFLLGINHGQHLKNESYAYAILPDINYDALKKWHDNPSVDIIENSPRCQAAQGNGITYAVFYEACELCTDKINICVDKPCVMMLTWLDSGYELLCSNPLHEEEKINVSLSGSKNVKIIFDFNGGIRYNNLGRALCYNSEKGFIPRYDGKGEHKSTVENTKK